MKTNFKVKTDKGFTIIELLVAMAILGLLIAILIPGIAIVRRGARNTARRTSLQAIQALVEEVYGTTRQYPAASANAPVTTAITTATLRAAVDQQFTTVTAAANCTTAPNQNQFMYRYVRNATSTGYTLVACMEPRGEYVVDITQ
jgi:prepilin-type N-terminal cleavage/methylation domain-containing protein